MPTPGQMNAQQASMPPELLAQIPERRGSIMGGGGLTLFHRLVRAADGSEIFPLVLQTTIRVVAIALPAVTGVVAAALPALNAARLDPVEALRYE